ncbi:cytochrome P450 [Biscogniauxia mediterranea]|nr:cytochrome P450 [Biscogniauxia mediterranea]
MASPSALPSLGQDWNYQSLIPTKSTPYFILTLMVMIVAYAWPSSTSSSVKKLPLVNPGGFFSMKQAKQQYRQSSKSILKNARKQYGNQPFRMITDLGEVVILPSEFIDEIRNEPKLSFSGGLEQERTSQFPEFEAFAVLHNDSQLLQTVLKKQLTKFLSKVTEPLAQEGARAVSLNLGESQEWRELALRPAMLDIVARMSSRVFLGEEICQNKEWLDITKEFTVNFTGALFELTAYPVPLRRFVHWFLPLCKGLRATNARAKEIIAPVIAKRAEIRRAAQAAGQEVPFFNDALDWLDQEAKALGTDYSPDAAQLVLSFVAIHTSSDLLGQVILDIAQHPEIVPEVREEIVRELRANGWKKTSLYNMKLLDSIMKESQRRKPIGMAIIRRSVTEDLRLSNGLLLKKGMRIHVDMHRMQDEQVYENPDEWVPKRFLDMRTQPGKEHLSQFVATSGDHFGFGHGEHACPGRFFASNELKVALCHLLLKYDWKLAPGTAVDPLIRGFSTLSCPTAKVLIQRRENVELDIDSI